MVWFRVDDNLALHPKVVEAGNAAMGLWVRAGAWSAANLTDGYVPTRVALRLGSRSLCQKLVNAGLFEVVENGWNFHDWDAKNFTKSQVEANRESTQKRVSDHRKRRLAAVPQQNGVTVLQTAPLPFPSLPFSRDSGKVSPVGSPPSPEPPPPKSCPEHPDGTPKPCQACQVVRQNYEKWKAAIAAIHRATINACIYCDDNGMRETNTNTLTRCSHNTDTFLEESHGR